MTRPRRPSAKPRKARKIKTWHYFCHDPTCIPSEAMEHICYSICALAAALDQRLASIERMGPNQWELLEFAELLLCRDDEPKKEPRRKTK